MSVPNDSTSELRDQLAEALAAHDWVWDEIQDERRCACGVDAYEGMEVHHADVLLPLIEARVQAAAKQGAAEVRGRWITALGVLAARHNLRWFALELRDRTAALTSPAPAPHAEEAS